MSTDLVRPAPSLRDLIVASKPKLAEVCARHLSAERITRLAVAACQRTPKLLECTPSSVLGAIFVAARLGLEPDGVLGGAYLVPFFNNKTRQMECQLIVGYRGLTDLALRSGKVRSVQSRVVHEHDRFRVRYGTEQSIVHVPAEEEDPGAWTHVYAVATLVDGATQFEVMSRRQVEGIKARSKAKDFGPWVTDEEEMARKTVIRRLSKSLPLSTEFAGALSLQAAAEAGEPNVGAVAAQLDVAIPPAQVIDAEPATALPPPQATGSVADLKAAAKAKAETPKEGPS